MIPLPKFKELLGYEAIDMMDEEIEKLRDHQYAWANLIFDDWLEKKNRAEQADTAYESHHGISVHKQ